MTEPSSPQKKNYKWLIPVFITVLILAGLSYYLTTLNLDPNKYPINFQDAASPVAENLHKFHNMLLVIITGISVFVLLLLIVVVARFNAKANPEPSKVTHNVLLEVVWTIIPVILLIIIVVPSLKLLFFMDRTANPEMTLKVVGYQWNWGYEYPDNDGLTFTSYMIPDKDIDLEKGQRRLLSTDNPIVLPVDTNIQILVTAADVLHSFAVPALGLKTDAVPGRLNETWVRITKPGIYFGQCSELCGKGHGYMPIEIHAVPKDAFAAWTEAAKTDLTAANAAAALATQATAEPTESDITEDKE